MPSTGKTSGACPGYRKDHIRPLTCGGPDKVQNLQWQTIADARAKPNFDQFLTEAGEKTCYFRCMRCYVIVLHFD